MAPHLSMNPTAAALPPENTRQLVKGFRLEAETAPDDADTVIHKVPGGGPGLQPEVVTTRWTRRSLIGSGGFGVVFKEQCTGGASMGEVRAVKEIPAPKTRGGRDSVDIERELGGLAVFSKPKFEAFFVKAFGWYQTSPSKICIPMEYLPLGDLGHHIEDHGPLREEDARLVIHQITVAVEYMHNNKFAHRDLKPQNILIKTRPLPLSRDRWWVKLADFGISKHFKQSSGITSSAMGTPAYMAPELLAYCDDDDDGAAELDEFHRARKADMWALGETTHVVLTGKNTFQDQGFKGLHDYARRRCAFPFDALDGMGLGAPALHFVEGLMSRRPADRPEASEALRRPWLQRQKNTTDVAARRLFEVTFHEPMPPRVVFFRDGKRAVMFRARKIGLVDTSTGALTRVHEDAGADFMDCAVSPDDRFVLALEECGRLTRFDGRTLARLESRWDGVFRGGFCAVAYSHTGDSVVTAHWARLSLWTIERSTLPRTKFVREIVTDIGGNLFSPRTLAFTETGGNRFVLTHAGGVSEFSFKRGRSPKLPHELRRIDYPAPGDNGLVSPDGNTVVHCGSAGCVHVWTRATDRWRRVIRESVDGVSILGVCISPDSRSLALAGSGSVVVRRASSVAHDGNNGGGGGDDDGSRSGQEVRRFKQASVPWIAMSPGPRRIVATTVVLPGESRVVFRELTTGMMMTDGFGRATDDDHEQRPFGFEPE